MQTYKPGSVSPAKAGDPHHLSSPNIAIGIDQPTHSDIPITIGIMDELPMSANWRRTKPIWSFNTQGLPCP